MKHGLLAELKRRHVYRVAIAYGVVGWAVIEIATQLFPVFRMPNWAEQLVVFIVALGWPIAVILAWAFEMTPEGVRRTEPADSTEARAPEQNRKIGQTLNAIIIGVLVVAVALLAWRVWVPHKKASKPSPIAAATSPKAPATASAPPLVASAIPAKSIAVLPFENLSEDKKNGYFADGMQDLILTKLADVGDLKVISRTSTMRFGSHPQDLRKIGRELGVATLLEGSVQKAGNQVLINVQLINARTDSHIWANSYQRTLKNVFGVEGEVAERIANALNAKLSPAETKRLAMALSNNTTANDLYLRAEYFQYRAFTNKDFFGALRRSISLYRKAIALAPTFASAHAGLSYSETLILFNNPYVKDFKELAADAGKQAKAAIKFAPNLAEAHMVIGWYDNVIEEDYSAASKAFAKALIFRPNYALAVTGYSFVLLRQGESDKALDTIKRAYKLDPRNTAVVGTLAEIYMSINQFDKAEQAYQLANALSPDTQYHGEYALSILYATGDTKRALKGFQDIGPGLNETRARILSYQRKYGAAIALIKSMQNAPGKANSGSYAPNMLMLGNLYSLSGNKVRARIYFAKALQLFRAQLPLVAGNMFATAKIWIGIAQAELGLGKKNTGMAAIKASLDALKRSHNQWEGLKIFILAAANYAHAGRAKKASMLISRALATPGIGYSYAPVLLWLDPAWDPIRKTPAFRALEMKYAKYRPAIVPKGTKG